jgi:hypothetical protein
MRKIIAGKVYDTDTAELICDISGNISDRSNFGFDDTGLYRTPNGRFFVAGHGGPRSRWAQSTGQNSWSGGSGLKPIETTDARELAEQFADEATYTRLFGEPEAG